MPLHDLECECGFKYSAVISVNEVSDKYRAICPKCGEAKARRVFNKTPMVQHGGVGSEQQIGRMQKSFHDRFYKKDIDSVRHKHGNAIDDSLRGAELERISKKSS